jgi:hypothetical protein
MPHTYALGKAVKDFIKNKYPMYAVQRVMMEMAIPINENIIPLKALEILK